ncbi:hypothetical protein KR093_006819 [Drosophila rubida]|uniref:Centriolar coiled-coil protein of 110 kDa n=1 Tax=Drosophila rubida TaxID=30044 RepID=A0AAD4PR16_9MUSC|nr:hypothetical protein KR093_006819 [Drosophila rubida]
MDMDNASWAMDQLRRAASEENESRFLVGSSSAPYVSQFRIDGQPILPPLMTAERRRQMLQLKQRALELEAHYKEKQSKQSDSASDENSDSGSMSTVQRCLPQLQQTQTYIYDSTQQPPPPPPPQESPRCRPQTLQIHGAPTVVPSICVDPPTPLEPQLEVSASNSSNRLLLSTTHRKLNNITSRIMRFERQAGESQPLDVLWQDKRMLRSSTSPALLLPPPGGQQMQRSRSFTLDEPSPALLAHLRRMGHKEVPSLTTLQPQEALEVAPTPPPPPPPPPTVAVTASATSPRCRFAVSSCSSAQSLAHLRRHTVESKAKQVQRSASSSQVDQARSSSSSVSLSMGGRRCGGFNAHAQRTLQQQQLQLKQLLQRALHEAEDVLDGQDEQERKQLTLAKHQMFKDIQLAHRDRFQQLVQYQHEEQRRMQAEFDRQQRFLIDQICADINVSAYSGSSDPPAASGTAPDAGAEPAAGSEPSTSHNETVTLSPRDSVLFTARKRLFDGGADTESDAPSELLPLDSTPRAQAIGSSSSHNKARLRKPVQQQRSQSVARKQPSPVPHAAGRTPPARRPMSSNKPTTALASRPKPQPHQPQQKALAKTRRSASPSRQSLQQRREEAATLLCAATRGFLVRRLFRTEQVQLIVQTIRDTLIFVLNLHMETTIGGIDHEEPANIRLKARLLQQLCSASRTLHLIFFQTSIKERMEIIARDRKRIKTKLMALHVKQRQ